MQPQNTFQIMALLHSFTILPMTFKLELIASTSFLASIAFILWTPWALYRSICKKICTQAYIDYSFMLKLAITSLIITGHSFSRFSFAEHIMRGDERCFLYIEWLQAIALALLILVQHHHETRPSATLSLFLAYYIAVHIIHIWLSVESHLSARAILSLTPQLALKSILLYLHENPSSSRLQSEIERPLSAESTRGYWNYVCSLWMAPLFTHSKSNLISLEAMDQPTDRTRAFTSQAMFDAAWAKHRDSRYALMKTCYSLQTASILYAAAWRLVLMLLNLSLPMFILQYVSVLERHRYEHHLDYGSKYLPAFTAILLFFGSAFCNAASNSADSYIQLTTQRMVMDAITRKVLEIPTADLSKTATPSLLSQHVTNIGENLSIIFKAFINALEFSVTFYLLWDAVGFTAIAITGIGVGVSMLFCILLQKNHDALQLWTSKNHDRLSHAQHLIQSLKVAKMSNIANITQHAMEMDRNQEVKSRDKYWVNNARVYGILISTNALIPAFALYLCQGDFDVNYRASQILSFLTIVVFLSNALRDLPEFPGWWSRTSSSFHYLEEFLHIPSEVNHMVEPGNVIEMEPDDPVVVQFVHTTISSSDTSPIVREIDVSILQQSLTVITGDVGSGKSIFLRSIVDRHLVRSGTLAVNVAAIGYCAEDAWVQNLSIRDNIVGPSTFEEDWYNQVLDLCCLEEDIGHLIGRDAFIAGRFGANLSQSLQHRIAIARAVYSRAALLLLDDSFSMHSASVASQLLARLFSPNGVVRRTSTIVVAATDPEPWRPVCDRFLKISDTGRVVSLAANNLDPEQQSQLNGTISEHVQQLSQGPITETTKQLRQFSNDIDRQFGLRMLEAPIYEHPGYWAIFKRVKIRLIVVCGILLVGELILEEFPVWVLRQWFPAYGTIDFPHLFSVFLTAGSGLLYSTAIHLFRQDILSPVLASIYDGLLESIFSASMASWTTVNIQSCINLICEGVHTMDQSLYHGTFNVLYSFLVIASGLTFAALQHRTAIVLYPVCFSLFCIIYRLYGSASYQLLQLHIKSSASLCTAFAETAAGSIHIQTFRWQTLQSSHLQRACNEMEKVQAYTLASKRWLALAIDITLAILNCTTVIIGLTMSVEPFKAGIGIFIFIYMRFMAMKLFSSVEKLDACCITMKQIEDFKEQLRQEPKAVQGPVQHRWPGPGHIRFQNVHVGYDPAMTTSTLRRVSLVIPAGTQTGFYGSPGCGKTTLNLALLNRLPYTGSITIDGVEVRDLPQNAFKTLFTIIPQQPVTFPHATIRQNLCPSEILLDYHITDDKYAVAFERVLYSVGLWGMVLRAGGLTALFSTLNFTPEQLHRFSVAQGLVSYYARHGKIIIVDGATSHVNAHSLQQLRDAMRNIFVENVCTILTSSNTELALHGSRLVFGMRYGNVLRLIGPNPD